MDTAQWIAHVDQQRAEDQWLKRGEWHGYKRAVGGEAPMRGEFYVVRWAEPTIAVSRDKPEDALALAKLIERALAQEDTDG